MSLSINQNITALNAWRNLKNTDSNLSSSMEKLSSGLRINRAADDPAGLVISEKMRAQLSGVNAAIKNAEKAVNMISTAEAALDKVNSLLNKMRQLALDSANLGVNDDAMLQANQDELDEAIDSITRIAKFTQFGTRKLIDGSLDGDYAKKYVGGPVTEGSSSSFQIGANENQSVKVNIGSVKAFDIGRLDTTAATYSDTTSGISYTDPAGIKQKGHIFAATTSSATVDASTISLWKLRSQPANDNVNYLLTNGSSTPTDVTFQDGVFMASDTMANAISAGATKADAIAQAIAVIDKAVADVSTLRGKLGAVQSDNLQISLDSLRVAYENLQASESTIRDTDMSAEMATFTKYQIMMQAGTAMLAQANQIPQTILQLLQ